MSDRASGPVPPGPEGPVTGPFAGPEDGGEHPAPASPPPEGAGDLSDPELADLRVAVEKSEEYLDALRRVQADFENYKKRMIKQQTEYLERANEALVTKLLPVIDAMDLAIAHSGDPAEGDDTVPVRQLASMMVDALAREGLQRIDPLGQPFDPTAHDAVAHEEGGGGEPQVSEVLRPGYRWKGRVIRPAMVKVKG